jgi:D-alanine-D-alanine ligase
VNPLPPVSILYNAPTLSPGDEDYASEAGVLDSVVAIEESLRKAGHEVHRLVAGQSAAELVQQLSESRPAVIVNLCESYKGNSAAESYIAALLELLELPYTGSPPDCLGLARDKPKTKRLLSGAGVATPEFIEVHRGETDP